MLSKNEYLEQMMKTVNDWHTDKRERDARKQEIIQTLGWDSPELKAWYEEDATAKFPFTGGECKALRAWNETRKRGEDEVEMNDFLWDSEVEDFVTTLRKAGIRTFVYTDSSSAVMGNLHELVAQGCTMMGLCTISRLEDRFGGEELVDIRGIRFSLN